MIIGIDPGFTGAIAVVKESGTFEIHDMPTTTRGGKTVLNIHRILYILKRVHQHTRIFLERAQAMPKQGVVGVFRYAESYGMLQGLIVSQYMTYVTVPPQAWKKRMGLIKKSKEESVELAKELFPEFKPTLKKHHNQAEALLLAYWGNNFYKGEYDG